MIHYYELLIILLLCTIRQISSSTNEKLVVASLNAQWSHSSHFAETSEFIAQTRPAEFWRFVESFPDIPEYGDSHNKAGYDLSLSLARPFLREPELRLLKFSLSLHVFAPKIQSFQQIAEEWTESSRCESFFEVNGHASCNIEELDSLLTTSVNRPTSQIYSIDHKYSFKNVTPVAVLYANVQSREFKAFHGKFKESSIRGELNYVFRHFHKPKEIDPSLRLSLSGYGVELAIKSTEYKAIDDTNAHKYDEDSVEAQNLHGFNFTHLRRKYEHLQDALTQFRIHLSELDELAPLKQWQVSDISLQAAQQIMQVSPDQALSVLIDLAQNFPIRARTLVQTRIPEALRTELALNLQRFSADLELQEGGSTLLLNGIPIDIDSLDIFNLFQILSQEIALAQSFFDMGIKRDYQTILYDIELTEEKTNSYAIDYRESFPDFLNNLDKDKAYRDWGNSVKLLLQPYFPGMIRPIARNLFTLVCIVDPTAPESRALIKIAYSLFQHQVPLRIGFVFVLDEEGANKKTSGLEHLGVALLNLYNFAKSDKGSPAKAIAALLKLYGDVPSEKMAVESVHSFFRQHYSDQSIDDVFGPESDYDEGRAAGANFFRQSGLRRLPSVLVNGVMLDELRPDNLEEAILMQVMRQTHQFQTALIRGQLSDSENVANWVIEQPNVLPRLNTRLIGAPTTVLSFAPTQKAIFDVDLLRYLTKAEDAQESTLFMNVWLVGDFGTAVGRQLLSTGLKALKKSSQMRLAFIHNGGGNGEALSTTPNLLLVLLDKLPTTLAKQAINKLASMNDTAMEDLLRTGAMERLISGGQGVDLAAISNALTFADVSARLQAQQQFARGEMGLAPGQRALAVNGLVYGPLDEDGESIEVEDFALVEKLLEKRGARAVAQRVDEWRGARGPRSSTMTLRAWAALAKHATKRKRQLVELDHATESVIHLVSQDDTTPALKLVAIVDPLSIQAQKLAPILQTLLRVVNADLDLALNPKSRLSELPLKRFYRYVLSAEPSFYDGEAGELIPRSVSFAGLPTKQLFTLNPIVPDSWMVQSAEAEFDLDNIKLASAPRNILARYELTHILLEGHCFDDDTGNPPRGLQFVLGTKRQPAQFDTIVMANLGYFQLKSAPGIWTLGLREGRSREIYLLRSSGEAESESLTDEQMSVVVDGFSGKTMRIRVAKRPGMESRGLLSDEDDAKSLRASDDEEAAEEALSGPSPPSIWSSLSSKLLGGQERYDRINIFSLASGHLYERFMRIMMLSVVRNTNRPVKFWLLNNYLSPQFRDSLPVLARNYGLEFELIEYKWPRWLHQQTQKQRIMWGYKILFLDVLFPLDVKKVIFVDADQVVRTDMMELMDHDLNGAPYGYTPFCDSRRSMDGFRFWRSGYWATHLAGRKYHISALYVVDLQKFRQIAAGDRLRGQYQGLSADPNSLSNLDQDLPNNMIHQVRIASLPQDWLWCETWCDDGSKQRAKTIDLCNNPQTKEPKLESAIRIIPEWTEYDTEIRTVLQKHYKGLLAAGQDNGEAADESVPSLADSEEKIEKINRQPPLDQQDSVEHDEF